MATLNITIDLDLSDLENRLANPTPVLKAWASVLVSESKLSFKRERSPDGSPWPSLTQQYLAKKQRATGKNRPIKGGNKILVFSGTLENTIFSEVQGDAVVVGAGYKVGRYSLAAIHHFGAPNAKIPPRPFLPVDSQGELFPAIRTELEQIAVDYFS